MGIMVGGIKGIFYVSAKYAEDKVSAGTPGEDLGVDWGSGTLS